MLEPHLSFFCFFYGFIKPWVTGNHTNKHVGVGNGEFWAEISTCWLLSFKKIFFLVFIEENPDFSSSKTAFLLASWGHQPIRLSRDTSRSKSRSAPQQGADPPPSAAHYLLIVHHLCKHSSAFLSKHDTMLPNGSLQLLSPNITPELDNGLGHTHHDHGGCRCFSSQMCTGWTDGLIWKGVKEC